MHAAVRRVALTAAAAVLALAVLPGGAGASSLPLMAAKVDPNQLPEPFGISVTVYGQDQPYAIEKLGVNIPGVTFDDVKRLNIQNHLAEQDAQLDVYVLPFLNLFGFVGSLTGQTAVNMSALDIPAALGAPAGFRFDNLHISYHGTVYGVGATLAGGNDRYFGSLTGIWTREDLSGDFDSSARALVISPKLGMHTRGGSFWIGAMYQHAQEDHKGTIDLNVGLPQAIPVGFSVKLQQRNDWNGLVGMQARVARQLDFAIEGGFGDRRSVSAALTYRF